MADRRELERRYGLEPGDYEILLRMGNEVCWICGQPESVPNRSLAIDHCHETGFVRGLLCTRCNQVLGRVRDNPDLLRRAAKYLDQAATFFSDCCPACYISCPPTRIVDRGRRGGHMTMFRYDCSSCNAWWTCSYNTFGPQLEWR